MHVERCVCVCVMSFEITDSREEVMRAETNAFSIVNLLKRESEGEREKDVYYYHRFYIEREK